MSSVRSGGSCAPFLPNWMFLSFFVSSFLLEGRFHAVMYMMNEIYTIQLVEDHFCAFFDLRFRCCRLVRYPCSDIHGLMS
jgi:hypothetical protein